MLAFTSVIIPFIIGLGVLIDNYQYNATEKSRLYRKFEKWLEYVSHNKFPALHQRLVSNLVGFIDRNFNWKKPVAFIIKTILVSWILTTLFFLLGIHLPSCAECKQNITIWHDYLPWYPSYVLNYFFDLLTILITIWILKYLENKNLLVSIFGISLDLVLSYVLVAFYAATVVGSSAWAVKYGLGVKYIKITEAESLAMGNPEPLSLLYSKGLKDNAVVDSIRKENFGSDAKFIFETKRVSLKMMRLILREGPEIYSDIFRGIEPRQPTDLVVLVFDKNKSKRFPMEYSGTLATEHLILALSSFIPITLFLIAFLTLLISKEILELTRLFSKRFLKTSIQNSSVDDLAKFKPGTHFGIFLSFIVLLTDLIRHFF